MSVPLHADSQTTLSKRRYQRLIMSVPVVVNGSATRTIDWSAIGFRLPHELPGVGEEPFRAELIVPAGGLMFFFKIMAHHIHRNDDDGYAGYHFKELTDIEHDMLRALVIHFVSGGCFPLEDETRLEINRQAIATARADGLCEHDELGYAIAKA
ncbi:MAG TPA: PilZ domain-containing protein [Candidatus Sulfotelmatobacter sp.]|nr:PilZ domain-containing protein [Candidatus Sulfotelmatobacter sp.]